MPNTHATEDLSVPRGELMGSQLAKRPAKFVRRNEGHLWGGPHCWSSLCHSDCWSWITFEFTSTGLWRQQQFANWCQCYHSQPFPPWTSKCQPRSRWVYRARYVPTPVMALQLVPSWPVLAPLETRICATTCTTKQMAHDQTKPLPGRSCAPPWRKRAQGTMAAWTCIGTNCQCWWSHPYCGSRYKVSHLCATQRKVGSSWGSPRGRTRLRGWPSPGSCHRWGWFGCNQRLVLVLMLFKKIDPTTETLSSCVTQDSVSHVCVTPSNFPVITWGAYECILKLRTTWNIEFASFDQSMSCRMSPMGK